MALRETTSFGVRRAASLAGMRRVTTAAMPRAGLPARSGERWSMDDILLLRIIEWLRHSDGSPHSVTSRTSMTAIGRAAAAIRRLDRSPWSHDDGATLIVDRMGHVRLCDAVGRESAGDALDVLAPFRGARGIDGPDLRFPRPHLRIVPGKLAGEPHVAGTRVDTQALGALALRGYAPRNDVTSWRPENEEGTAHGTRSTLACSWLSTCAGRAHDRIAPHAARSAERRCAMASHDNFDDLPSFQP